MRQLKNRGEGVFYAWKVELPLISSTLALISLSTPDVAETALIQTLPDSAKVPACSEKEAATRSP